MNITRETSKTLISCAVEIMIDFGFVIVSAGGRSIKQSFQQIGFDVSDSRPAACQTVGGVGIKYTCVVLGKITELWEEKDQWFVVVKHPQ